MAPEEIPVQPLELVNTFETVFHKQNGANNTIPKTAVRKSWDNTQNADNAMCGRSEVLSLPLPVEEGGHVTRKTLLDSINLFLNKISFLLVGIM